MELRHLRYFVAVVEAKGFREASRRLHVAQPAISLTMTHLEEEIGVQLLERSGRGVQLTAEGEVFYRETLQTLEQSRRAVEVTQRAARGEVGALSVGFCGADTQSFMPDLVRQYKTRFPGVKVNLVELNPSQQEVAFAAGAIDVGFTRVVSADQLPSTLQWRKISRDPFLAVLPACRPVRSKRIKVDSLAKERFILYHRKGAPAMYDSIVRLCNERGFAPQVENEPEVLHTVLTLVAADQGVAIVPTCAVVLRFPGIQFLRLQPDHFRTELGLVWPKKMKAGAARFFLDLVEANYADIRRKIQST